MKSDFLLSNIHMSYVLPTISNGLRLVLSFQNTEGQDVLGVLISFNNTLSNAFVT
jgi:hypothetical protein